VDIPPKWVNKLDPSRPAAEQISSSLKAAILDMDLAPGHMISESDIAQLFGASRTPVRESFTWLREQGLIETYPSRGSYVSKLSIPELKGAQFVRESLEVSVAELLCDRGLPDETVEEIEENLESQKSLVKAGNGKEFHLFDDTFHLVLANAVGHARTSQIIQREKTNLDRLRVLELHSPEHLQTLLTDHLDIFNAIRQGDEAEARQSVRKHLRRVLGTLSDLFVEHHEYFHHN